MKSLKDVEKDYTKYEVARILGARALQISMDAPLLVKIDKDVLERIKYDPIKISEIELLSEALPITVKRPLPRRAEEKKIRIVESEEDDKKIEKRERAEEKEILESGDIMELANPEDEGRNEEKEREEGIEE
ncbi:DNA-directed RNA polymerase subunit K [Candidatus Pacearchaeota archaeon CG10_big_fil_rev_8_21_14_0_10_35_13]|nr:MAG: DNA-directed RNA polymerase subunit K [Candidatus Pacearchaeota archaeon CG10_big_fil_rev_8_21_14_0_10_35_13]